MFVFVISHLSTCYANAADSFDTVELGALFSSRCYDCHSSGADSEGGIDLTEVLHGGTWTGHPEQLQKVLDVIDLGEMPPASESPLQQLEREQATRLLTALMKSTVALTIAERSQTPIRRMNRFQYSNSVQDLFKLKPVVFSLPEKMLREHAIYFRPDTGTMPDVVNVGCRPLGKSQLIEPRLAGVNPFPQDLRAENGFDNQGDHLSLSPLLMESFLSLSRSIVESPDFHQKSCGIWNDFFETPPAGEDFPPVIRNRLQLFLNQAFRGHADNAAVDRYTSLAIRLIESGETFEDVMKQVAAAAIASPMFLYLHEPASRSDVPTVARAETQNALNLATRMSFFLWGSLPDNELLLAAQSGRLSDPIDYELQIERMLDDRRLKRFCDTFPAQWLQLDRLISAVPDREVFPDFYFSKYRLSMHMMLEPLLVFETVLIEDRPITELIDSNFSYRSNRLSKSAYGKSIPPLKGNDVTVIPFQRVKVTDRREGGCLTTAAVMAMTSGPHESKPITRGAWLTTVVFNNPPEPPPADVPPLAEKPSAGEVEMTLRERLDAHRERADCAGCHERIDPLGFALENYDPIGRWRDSYSNGRTIDMGGVLFRRLPFTNVVEFKDAILSEKRRFAKAFAGHLLSFALARELTVWDQPDLERIVDQCADDDYRMRSMLVAVMNSNAFRGIAAGSGHHVSQRSPGNAGSTK